MALELVRWGGERLRVGPWRGDAAVAYLAVLADRPPPTPEAVRACCDVLRERGYVRAITAALGPHEARGFLLAGFEIHERLHLLVHDLLDIPEPPPVRLRRARRADRAQVLTIDGLAFEPFWTLDDEGLDEAVRATPSTRFRVAATGSDVSAYAVTGRGGRRGFVQRLGVHPAARGRGLGRALVIDGLRWMRWRGARDAYVNTQEKNERALRLYEALGFRRQPAGLAVLHRKLG